MRYHRTERNKNPPDALASRNTHGARGTGDERRNFWSGINKLPSDWSKGFFVSVTSRAAAVRRGGGRPPSNALVRGISRTFGPRDLRGAEQDAALNAVRAAAVARRKTEIENYFCDNNRLAMFLYSSTFGWSNALTPINDARYTISNIFHCKNWPSS